MATPRRPDRGRHRATIQSRCGDGQLADQLGSLAGTGANVRLRENLSFGGECRLLRENLTFVLKGTLRLLQESDLDAALVKGEAHGVYAKIHNGAAEPIVRAQGETRNSALLSTKEP